LKEGKKTVHKKFLAALMLNGANGTKYNNLKRSMKENFVTGTSTSSKSPEAVLCILNAYQPSAGWGKHRQDAGAGTKEGAVFAQTEGDNSWKTRVNCHNCGKKGHIAWECLERNKTEIKNTSMPIFRRMGAMKMTSTKGRTCSHKRERKGLSTRIGSYWTVRAWWIKLLIQHC
jgi:hypothetical protein